MDYYFQPAKIQFFYEIQELFNRKNKIYSFFSLLYFFFRFKGTDNSIVVFEMSERFADTADIKNKFSAGAAMSFGGHKNTPINTKKLSILSYINLVYFLTPT